MLMLRNTTIMGFTQACSNLNHPRERITTFSFVDLRDTKICLPLGSLQSCDANQPTIPECAIMASLLLLSGLLNNPPQNNKKVRLSSTSCYDWHNVGPVSGFISRFTIYIYIHIYIYTYIYIYYTDTSTVISINHRFTGGPHCSVSPVWRFPKWRSQNHPSVQVIKKSTRTKMIESTMAGWWFQPL